MSCLLPYFNNTCLVVAPDWVVLLICLTVSLLGGVSFTFVLIDCMGMSLKGFRMMFSREEEEP